MCVRAFWSRKHENHENLHKSRRHLTIFTFEYHALPERHRVLTAVRLYIVSEEESTHGNMTYSVFFPRRLLLTRRKFIVVGRELERERDR